MALNGLEKVREGGAGAGSPMTVMIHASAPQSPPP
jgi:hypothetical protein